MASPGHDASADSTLHTAQHVLWLASCEPPAGYAAFLRSRGLTLVAGAASEGTAAARLTTLESSPAQGARPPSMAGRRLAIIHPDPGSADALAQALRAKGAEVAALSLNPESLHRVEGLDPDVVIMEPADFTGSCWEIVRALWQHPRLRFSAVLLATPDLLGSERVAALDVHDLSFAVQQLAEGYERVLHAARERQSFSAPLAELGPARTLRALLDSGRGLRAHFVSDGCDIEVDVVEGIIVGAQSVAAPGEAPLLGVHALALLMAQQTGRVQVRPVEHPAETNVMAPLDTALHMAREVALQRGLRWAPVANQNASASSVRISLLPGKPSAPVGGGRTLIGIPAVQVDQSLARAVSDKPPPERAAQVPRPAKPEAKVTAPRLRPLEHDAAVGTRDTVRAEPGKLPALRAPSMPLPAPTSAPAAPTAPASSPTPARTFSVPPADLPSAPPPSLPPSAPPSAPPVVDLGMAEQLEPSYQARPSPSSAPPRGLQPVHFKLAGVALLALIALWLGVRIVAALSTASVQAAAPVKPPAPANPASASPAVATAPVAQAASDEEESEEADGERPSRRASELVSQGHSFRKKRLLPTARSRYLEALREYPGYPRALAGLAQLSLDGGDHVQALQYARQLVRVRPGQASYQLLLGDAHKAAGQASQARTAFEAAARLGSRVAKQRLATLKP